VPKIREWLHVCDYTFPQKEEQANNYFSAMNFADGSRMTHLSIGWRGLSTVTGWRALLSRFCPNGRATQRA
jgi:hypothetical protein